MAWERRRNGRRYLYHAKRRDGRVVKTYLGHGEAARAFERERAEQNRVRAEKRAAARRLIQRVTAVEAEVSLIEDRLKRSVEHALTEAGFKWHRGSWRKTQRSRDDHVRSV